MSSPRNRRVVRIAMGIFVLWMLLQATRAYLTKEPYPAIYYPGFASDGSELIEDWELQWLASDGWRKVHFHDTNLSHGQFKKMIGHVIRAHDRSDEEGLIRTLNGIRQFRGMEANDSIKVVETLWGLVDGTYIPVQTREINLRL